MTMLIKKYTLGKETIVYKWVIVSELKARKAYIIMNGNQIILLKMDSN